ncbi:hypothetical protein U9M48_040221 [Paspalum notatum var. saurae]|uniref:Integrase catalytic domain-containing protein n=1 Tax=Paspalum notatum var. saurae TaxID=547442 RepID=A0AAQ3XDH6_PASNO
MPFLMVSCVRKFICSHRLGILFLRVWFVVFDALSMVLSRAPRAWFQRFASWSQLLVFREAHDPALFVHTSSRGRTFLLLYVDDMIIIGDDPQFIEILSSLPLSRHFLMSDLGPLRYFLGIEVSSTHEGFFLPQEKYIQGLLDRASFTDHKTEETPMELNLHLSATDGEPLDDPTRYRHIVGSLVYLGVTRPDISYSVHILSQFVSDLSAPTQLYYSHLLRVLRYLRGTISRRLFFPRSSSLRLRAYRDATWASDSSDRRSLSLIMFFLVTKKRTAVSRSSTEAELRAMALVTAEVTWLRFWCFVSIPTPLLTDGTSAISIARDPVKHELTKHIGVDAYYTRARVRDGVVTLRYVPSSYADNSCTVEFDSSGLTVKDSASRRPLLRCDSQGPLYTLRLPPSVASPSASPSSAAFVATTSSTTWHRRLGHPGRDVLAQLSRSADLPCTRAPDEHLCHACQLGRHIACLILYTVICGHLLYSVSGYTYYLVVVDDFSHYSWTFPLRFKSETFSTLSHFFAWVSTQFGLTIKAVQCDNGREFDNNASRSFFLTRGVQLRMSCPYTSAQNGKAERMIRTTNDVMRTLLFQASLPARFWAESLHTATYLINRLPSTASPAPTPHHALFGTPPRYDHLRVFGCACYPNTSATAPHKLAPRSTRCVFLGYSPDHKGYRCFDLTSRRVLISRHVVFDESRRCTTRLSSSGILVTYIPW